MNLFRRLLGQKQSESASSSVPVVSVTADESTPPSAPAPIHTRKLSPPKEYTTSASRMKIGITSNIGGRGNNEDAALAILINAELTGSPPPLGLFVVADGMGGHQDGEHASAITTRTLAQFIINDVVLPQLEDRGPNSDQKTIPEVLSEAMAAANASVQEQVPGGGTTATCAVIRGDLAFIAHVGDSRAYLFADGNLEVITRDHLLVRRLQELGQLTAQEADTHPQRNVLYRAIGQSETLEIDAATRRLTPSSRMLLCCDGLWGVIGDDGIRAVLTECPDPQEACDRLIDAANASGGQDNITAVIIQMPD
jgi:serine/threonine protein phosphatase PrpC